MINSKASSVKKLHLALFLSMTMFMSSCIPAVRMGISLYGVLAVGGKIIAEESVSLMVERGIDNIINYFSGKTTNANEMGTREDPLAQAVNLRNKNDLKAGSLAHFNTEVTAYLNQGGRKYSGIVKIQPSEIRFERVDQTSPWDFSLESKRLIKERRNLGIIQAALQALNYPEVGRIDGRYGPKTKSAIINFQKKHNLPQTGRPDPATISEIERLVTIDVRGHIL